MIHFIANCIINSAPDNYMIAKGAEVPQDSWLHETLLYFYENEPKAEMLNNFHVKADNPLDFLPHIHPTLNLKGDR